MQQSSSTICFQPTYRNSIPLNQQLVESSQFEPFKYVPSSNIPNYQKSQIKTDNLSINCPYAETQTNYKNLKTEIGLQYNPESDKNSFSRSQSLKQIKNQLTPKFSFMINGNGYENEGQNKEMYKTEFPKYQQNLKAVLSDQKDFLNRGDTYQTSNFSSTLSNFERKFQDKYDTLMGFSDQTQIKNIKSVSNSNNNLTKEMSSLSTIDNNYKFQETVSSNSSSPLMGSISNNDLYQLNENPTSSKQTEDNKMLNQNNNMNFRKTDSWQPTLFEKDRVNHFQSVDCFQNENNEYDTQNGQLKYKGIYEANNNIGGGTGVGVGGTEQNFTKRIKEQIINSRSRDSRYNSIDARISNFNNIIWNQGSEVKQIESQQIQPSQPIVVNTEFSNYSQLNNALLQSDKYSNFNLKFSQEVFKDNQDTVNLTAISQSDSIQYSLNGISMNNTNEQTKNTSLSQNFTPLLGNRQYFNTLLDANPTQSCIGQRSQSLSNQIPFKDVGQQVQEQKQKFYKEECEKLQRELLLLRKNETLQNQSLNEFTEENQSLKKLINEQKWTIDSLKQDNKYLNENIKIDQRNTNWVCVGNKQYNSEQVQLIIEENEQMQIKLQQYGQFIYENLKNLTCVKNNQK